MPTPNKPGSPTPGGAKPTAAKAPGKSAAARPPSSSGRRPPTVPPKRASSTSIVDRPQRPWGLIATTAVVVIFAISIIGYALTRPGTTEPNVGGAASSVAPAVATAAEIAAIPGVAVKSFPSGNHTAAVVDYGPDSPPFGGEHNPIWAACTGVVYPNQIANENAVHMLEHGAIWITYQPDLDQKSKDALASKVNGINFMAMSPYAGLKTPISLQAWGFQLFLNSADDPRIDEFISKVRLNPNTVPEYGSTCNQPAFKPSESTPGHPFNG